MTCAYIPDTNSLVVTATDEDIAQWSEGNRIYSGTMASQGLEAVIGMHIPEANCAILIATGENFPIIAESYGPDPASLPRKFFLKIPFIHIPYPKSFIMADTHKDLIVRAKGNVVDYVT